MNIALLTQYYKPEMGAPQNRLYEMMSGLKENGNQVCVVTGMPNYPSGKIFEGYKSKFSCIEKLDDIPVKRFWLYASNAKRTLPRIWNMLSFSITALFSLRFLKKQRIDYLIVESPPLTLGITGYILARFTGARLVMNISDLWPLSAKELGAMSDGLLYQFLEKTESFLYKKSLFCMGQSEEIVSYIENHGAISTYLFRNGVDPSRFKVKLKTENKTFRIVYAGLLGYAQGIYEICRHVDFASLGVEFHIYGAGGEQQLIEAYLSSNQNKNIFFHGKITREDIPKTLTSADATLIPLVKNIFGAVPSKIYESMAAGVPILFSGEGESVKIIEENNIGIISPPKDYTSLSKNIQYMANNPEEMTRMQQNCVKCANEKFNRPKQVNDLHKFLLSKIE